MKYHQASKIRASSGFSMIEVLVTTLVLALGILGTSALQIMGLKGTDAAHYRTVATFIANDMADRIRMNPPLDNPATGDKNDMYETGSSTPISCNPINADTLNCNLVACDPSQLAIFDQTMLTCGHVAKTSILDTWSADERSTWNQAKKTGVKDSLPNGSITIDCGVNSCGEGVSHTITVAWTERVDTAEQSVTSSNVVLSILP